LIFSLPIAAERRTTVSAVPASSPTRRRPSARVSAIFTTGPLLSKPKVSVTAKASLSSTRVPAASTSSGSAGSTLQT
jgi:hypothetical protein